MKSPRFFLLILLQLLFFVGYGQSSTQKDFRSFQIGNDIFDIPKEKVADFLKINPEAKEIGTFFSGKDTLDIPLEKIVNFLNDVPDAKPILEYGWETPIQRLYRYLIEIDGFAISYGQFKIDMSDELNLKKLHESLNKKNGFAMPYAQFKDLITRSHSITRNQTLYFNWFFAPSDRKLKLIFDNLSAKNPEIKDYGYDSFAIDMKVDSNLRYVYDGLANKHPEWKPTGYKSFKEAMFPTVKRLKPITKSKTTDYTSVHFQIDKIKVGDTYIDLPIPSGFVKVDNTMGNLLESAKKLCPPTNAFLAYYISDEDYANFLANQDNTNEKYIIVEVFNGFKDLHVGYKDYRQFMNQYKNEYIDKYKKQYEDAEPKLSDHLSNLDERIKIKDFKVEPLGICYESKYSLSSGLLTKYNFSVENESSEDYIVAAISTITRVEDKPIFLFIYKNYRTKEDINSLKDINSAWLKEIEKKQGAFSFLSEIDFEDYKETILAILTLGFLWGAYFATRRIRRNLKTKISQEKPNEETKENLVDFDDLLVNEYPTIEPIIENYEDQISSEVEKKEMPIDLGSERKEKSIGDEFKETESKFQSFNPKFFIVTRRIRLFHFIIDMILVYAAAYFSGYILPLFIDVRILAPWLKEHNYLFGAIVIFVIYFLQEFIFGKTLGKLITGTHVVDAKGNKPTFWQFVGRTLSRMIPFESISFLFSEKRGWHDTISDTYVIKDR